MRWFGVALGCAVVLFSTISPLKAEPSAHSASSDRPVFSVDGGRYDGPLKDGKFNGVGRLVWKSGAVYEGGFQDGLLSGQGRLRQANGDVLEGTFVAGDLSGKGRHISTTGAHYEGEFLHGLYHGQGRYNDPRGMVYEGSFVRGMFEGRGKLTQADDEYVGEFRHGLQSGQGEIRYKDGRAYTGGFDGGQYQGKGRFTGTNGESYEGEFVAGRFSGRGVFAAPGGYRFEGEFKDWRPHGPGKLIDPSGVITEGTFASGELTGDGRIRWPDGSSYEGQTRGGMPNGVGTLRRANGDVYRGQFQFGEFDGEGTLTFAVPRDGQVSESGRWSFGRLKSKDEEERRRARAAAEAALYTQPALLARALEALQPSEKGRINMYLLALAGDGSQEVFRREVDFVRNQFDADFGTRGRSIMLVNSRNTAEQLPMATVTSLRRSIDVLAKRMDPEKDILFVFMTSHGSKDHALSLGLRGMDLPPLSATELASILKSSGIRWKVVVISACYAGGFMPPLANEGTLVLAAARHDRRSFGCSDENEFTYFGRAFFKESLPRSSSFQAAFAGAQKLITEWEVRDANTNKRATMAPVAEGSKEDRRPEPLDMHSLPQISDPPAIAKHLEAWWKQARGSKGP